MFYLTVQVSKHIYRIMDVNHNTNMNDFELYDFIEDPNFDQFIYLIRGENEDSICNYGSDIINDYFLDNNQLLPFAQTNTTTNNNDVVNVYDPSPTLSSFSCFDGVVNNGEGEEENEGEDSSSATTTATENVSTKQKHKTDRSKTLVSERRRRSTMKEKLYALRSLVPNITKMDKASIIGDAVSYVHELQAQAKKLKSEVAGLEASLLMSENYQGSIENPMKVQVTHINHHISKKIMQIEMYQVEERGYYVKMVCIKGEGVAASLYKALESLAGFNVRNSNLETVYDSFILTFTLNVEGSEPEINLTNLKLWVTGALINQGFEFMPSFHA